MVRNPARAFGSSSTTRMRDFCMVMPGTSNLHASGRRRKAGPAARRICAPSCRVPVLARVRRYIPRGTIRESFRGRRAAQAVSQPEETMKRILVGVDGSKESRDAAVYAAELARTMDSAAQWQHEENEHAAAIAQEVSAAIGGPGRTTETMVASGPPAEKLADLAQSGDVDLVVVGHRGRGAITRMLMGSVADRLVQICPKPVLVVR